MKGTYCPCRARESSVQGDAGSLFSLPPKLLAGLTLDGSLSVHTEEILIDVGTSRF